ncbi:MAG: MopE-related protein [Pseudomonadota bacterium]|nr:MopE-related protein [Pseudomonadota bacterium]
MNSSRPLPTTSHALLLTFLGCLLSCDGAVDAHPVVDRVHDIDGDGAGSARDCDDASADVFPGAQERCNGVDDDCDGTVDLEAADMAIWYADADRDGFGGAETLSACLAPEGWAAVGGDCDDADGDVQPAGTERCGGADEDCDGLLDDDDPDLADAATWHLDADGDGHGDPTRATAACSAPVGHVTSADDCDDSAGGVHPGAVEACDSFDQDCDGEADEGAGIEVYADADGDGWGDPGHALEACPVPEGWTALSGDCDDTDPLARPDGVEVCDEADRDEDCDGYADDADGDSVGATWHSDGDGDGFGDPASATTSCDAPAGHLADASDCDDADPSVNPAAAELCNAADDNCDGVTDGTDAADASTWYADLDSDGYGDAAASAGACDAPAGYVADDSDCADTDAARSPAGVETCDDGVDDDCDGIDTVCGRLSGTLELGASAALLVEGDSPGDLAGWAVAFAGDLDGDGADDVLIGAPESDASGLADGGQGGAVYGFFGGHAGTEPVAWADVTLLGGIASRAGLSLAPAGDLWGDGRAWILVGGMAGAYAVPSPYSMDLDDTFSEGGLICVKEADDDLTGWAVAGAEDMDGDGLPEHLVGAPYNDDGGDSSGKVYRGCESYYSLSSTVLTYVASYTGESAGDLAGAALSGAGDTDGDGLGDFLVGAPYDDDVATSSGKVYLVQGGGSAGDLDLASADASWVGTGAGDLAGTALWGGGDLDGDGYDDIGVGSGGAGAWVLFGTSASASGSLSDADVRFGAEADGDAAGADVSGGADVDGDGVADFVVSAPGGDRAAADGGVVYVIAGPLAAGTIGLDEADAFLVLDDVDGMAGWSIDATGDADGDGIADLLVGAPGLASDGTETGGAFLVLGGP